MTRLAETAHLGHDVVRWGLSQDEQKSVLLGCGQAVLEEALYMEQNGMAFAAKMSLLADSVEERMLYNVFASDEATHYYTVCGDTYSMSARGP